MTPRLAKPNKELSAKSSAENVSGLSSRTWLRREYREKGRTQEDIASELNCTQPAVHKALKKHGIPARSVGRAKQFDETMSDMASQFVRITDELTAQLLIDVERYEDGQDDGGVSDLSIINRRVEPVMEAGAFPSEWWATSRFLIELASSSLLCAMKKRVGKTFDTSDDDH